MGGRSGSRRCVPYDDDIFALTEDIRLSSRSFNKLQAVNEKVYEYLERKGIRNDNNFGPRLPRDRSILMSFIDFFRLPTTKNTVDIDPEMEFSTDERTESVTSPPNCQDSKVSWDVSSLSQSNDRLCQGHARKLSHDGSVYTNFSISSSALQRSDWGQFLEF